MKMKILHFLIEHLPKSKFRTYCRKKFIEKVMRDMSKDVIQKL